MGVVEELLITRKRRHVEIMNMWIVYDHLFALSVIIIDRKALPKIAGHRHIDIHHRGSHRRKASSNCPKQVELLVRQAFISELLQPVCPVEGGIVSLVTIFPD